MPTIARKVFPTTLLTKYVSAKAFEPPLEIEMSTEMSIEVIQSAGPELGGTGTNFEFAERGRDA